MKLVGSVGLLIMLSLAGCADSGVYGDWKKGRTINWRVKYLSAAEPGMYYWGVQFFNNTSTPVTIDYLVSGSPGATMPERPSDHVGGGTVTIPGGGTEEVMVKTTSDAFQNRVWVTISPPRTGSFLN